MAACQLSNNLRDIFVFAKLNYTAYFCGSGCRVRVGEATHRLLTAATQPPLITLSVSHSALSLVTVNFSLLPRVPFKNRQQGVNCSDPTSPLHLLLPTVTAFICFISFTYNSNWWPPFFAVSCRGGVAKINANHTQNSVKLLQVERIFFFLLLSNFLYRDSRRCWRTEIR